MLFAAWEIPEGFRPAESLFTGRTLRSTEETLDAEVGKRSSAGGEGETKRRRRD
jgi:hypothetical protein